MLLTISRPTSLHVALCGSALLFIVIWTSSSFRYDIVASSRLSGGREFLDHAATPYPEDSGTGSTQGDRPSAQDPYRSTLKRISDVLKTLDAVRIPSYEAALAYNEETCAGRDIQSNQDQLHGESDFWRGLTTNELMTKRSELIWNVQGEFDLPASLAENSNLEQIRRMYGEGRGIVYTGGNADTMARLFTSLSILRNRHGCTLPVEIFAFPEEMTEQPGQGLRGRIEALGGVTFRELHSSAKLKLWKNFQIKGEAVVKSSFTEVLYLDSDNILLADPSYLFSSPIYQEHGIVLWPDITKDGPANPIWRMTGVQCKPDEWQVDSGQILVDKKGQQGMNLAALVTAMGMQRDHEYWFKVSGGDKDTFRYAYMALGLEYTPSPHWLSSLGYNLPSPASGHTFCGLAMFQYSLSPSDWAQFPLAKPSANQARTHAPPLFVHVNLLKHSSGTRRGSTFTTLKRMKGDLVSAPMNNVRTEVVRTRGMCVDIWDAFEGPGGASDGGEVIVEDAKQAFGGVLDGFEEMYYAEGGRAGGF